MRLAVAAMLAVYAAGCSCSRPQTQNPADGGTDAGVRCGDDLDCPFGEACAGGRCMKPTTLDSGVVECTTDAQCPMGQKCLPSTNTCFTPAAEDAGEMPDAGTTPACQPGQMLSCGSSKFGECRLGLSTCAQTDAGWAWSACVGAIDAVPETCNGKDDDCDGLVDDGLGDTTCGVGECARTVASCLGGQPVACVPGAGSAEVCDGKDNDCDGMTDKGLPDLTCGTGECARTAPACVNGAAGVCSPGAPVPEVCNGKDDDCDGTPDDGFGTASCGTGVCARTAATCIAGVPNACVPGMPAAAEACNGLDDDCDGTIDEGCACTNGATQGCYTGPGGTQNVGPCKGGTQTCAGGAWGACVGQVVPAAETCNGVDDNCNAQTDEGLGTSSCGTGACARTVANCAAGAPQTCTPGPAGTETCNGVDDNCNGSTDEGLGTVSCGVGACRVTVAACVAGAPATCTPGAPGTEICNGQDDDCDGMTDETFPQSGQSCATGVPGLCATGQWTCSGTLTCAQTVMPVAEVCGNGLDENCNGVADDPAACGCNAAIDADLDGANQCVDCNDADGTIRPGAAEKCNGKDDNCVGGIDEGFDGDGDGFTTCGTKAGGGLDPLRVDCNDGNAFVFPLKVADCGNMATPTVANATDDNCNGYVDETCGCNATDKDNDGVTTCQGDCDDNDATVAPGRAEVCDGKDNDCKAATVDNCGVSEACGFKQGNTWYPWATGTDRCRPDLICVSNVGTGALTCGSFCNQTSGVGLNDSCAANEGCFRNLIDSDNQHLCSVLPVGALTTGQTCSTAASCRTGDCLTDGAVKYCSDKCTHEAGCSANTTCVVQRDPLGFPMVQGYYFFSFCRADSQITGTKTTGQACTTGSSECRTGPYGCPNGTCVEPCCANTDCAGGAACSINGPTVNTGYASGGSPIASVVPACVPSSATRVSGQACTTSSQCKSGICDNALGICLDVCCNDSSCPNATTCEPVSLKLSTGELTTARLCVFSPVPAQVVQK